MAAEMKAPEVPLGLQIKAFAQSIPPLLRTGALYMTPKTAPKILDYLRSLEVLRRQPYFHECAALPGSPRPCR